MSSSFNLDASDGDLSRVEVILIFSCILRVGRRKLIDSSVNTIPSKMQLEMGIGGEIKLVQV